MLRWLQPELKCILSTMDAKGERRDDCCHGGSPKDNKNRLTILDDLVNLEIPGMTLIDRINPNPKTTPVTKKTETARKISVDTIAICVRIQMINGFEALFYEIKLTLGNLIN
jgi:hypothetical protein